MRHTPVRIKELQGSLREKGVMNMKKSSLARFAYICTWS